MWSLLINLFHLATLETPMELRQEAWNLANDSLRTTLCVRFKSEVVACGVVADFKYPFLRTLLGGRVFDADKSGIDEVCRVLAQLYSLPKAEYIPVCKEGGSFATSNKSVDSSTQTPKEGSLAIPPADEGSRRPRGTSTGENQELGKYVPIQVDKWNDSNKSNDYRGVAPASDSRDEHLSNQYLRIVQRRVIKGAKIGTEPGIEVRIG